LELLIDHGIINWGDPIKKVLDFGDILIEKTRNDGGLVSVLLEGPPNAGKTGLAAQLAKKTNFPFIKICSPEDMVGFSESAKCLQIKKYFDDAYRSEMSCILIDNVERLFDYCAIGHRFSNIVLQTLLVLLKKQPPKGRKLLVICTTSRRQVLDEMEMLSTFTSVLCVPNVSTCEHLVAVLKETDVFSKNEIETITFTIANRRLFIGIKKLLAIIELVQYVDDQRRVSDFLTQLEEENFLENDVK
jgi:vesicle-fusing ATPase